MNNESYSTGIAARVQRRRARRTALRLAGAALTAGVLIAAAFAGPASAASGYNFTTLNNNADSTFNQLLGINDAGLISGYFGSGAQGHPNKGYRLLTNASDPSFTSENYPGAVQTQVTGLNDIGLSVGFWSDQDTANMMNDNFGFYSANGQYHAVNYPTSDNSKPAVNQLLGVNDRDQTVGFYNDPQGNAHAYEYDINENHYHLVRLPVSGVSSSTASSINNNDDVAGFATVHGNTDGWYLTWNGHFALLSVKGASMTQAFGVDDAGEVVGAYQVGSGKNAMSHGFTWTQQQGFKTVDDPDGIGSTLINGVNDSGDLVGFYTDSKGNTDGLLAAPSL